MGFLDRFKPADINAGVAQYRQTDQAVLLDVRSRDEYAQGHIPESRNLDVVQIQHAPDLITNKNTPIFVYCHSGARSSRAAAVLKRTGYSNVTNIGGIIRYHGPIER